MAFGMNLSNMVSIRSYEEAEAYFRATPQPKGKHWDQYHRPLDGVKKPHVYIGRGVTDTFYYLSLYGANLVSYYPDGRVFIRLDSRKASREFLDRSMPRGTSLLWSKHTPYLQCEAGSKKFWARPYSMFSGNVRSGHFLPTHSGLYLRVLWRIDRKRFHHALKEHAELLTWRAGIARLCGEQHRSSSPEAHTLIAEHIKDKAPMQNVIGALQNIYAPLIVGMYTNSIAVTYGYALNSPPASTPSQYWQIKLPHLSPFDELETT